MNSRQAKKLATSPQAMMRFKATGKLPEIWHPDSPLIRLLESISPRDRLQVRVIRLSPELGYTGNHLFHSAEQLLRWLKPPAGLVEGESCAAESCRIKAFTQEVTLDDLAKASQQFPETLLNNTKNKRRTAMRNIFIRLSIDEPENPADLTPKREEDLEQAGWYLCQVDDDLPDDKVANAVLDRFNSDIPVGELDYATFDVFDATGNPLDEDPDQESYELGDRATSPDRVDMPDWAEDGDLIAAKDEKPHDNSLG